MAGKLPARLVLVLDRTPEGVTATAGSGGKISEHYEPILDGADEMEAAGRAARMVVIKAVAMADCVACTTIFVVEVEDGEPVASRGEN